MMTLANEEYTNALERITNNPHFDLKIVQDLLVKIYSLPNQQIVTADVSTNNRDEWRENIYIGGLFSLGFLDCVIDKKNRRVFSIAPHGQRFIDEIKAN